MKDLRSFSTKDPEFHDPRFQRRITAIVRPVEFIDNMFDVTLECGHSPLIFVDTAPTAGQMMFCPECHEAANSLHVP